jgi:hypothetical protein
MKRAWVVVLMVAGVMTANFTASFAQEAENDKFSFGKVVNVGSGEITVKEYDFAKDADVDTAYVVTAETEFGNVNALADLVPNDDVVIDYVEKDGKRMVTTLVREEKGAEMNMPAPGPEAENNIEAAPMEDVAAVPAAVESPDSPALPEAPAQE